MKRPKIFLDQLIRIPIHQLVMSGGYWKRDVQNHSVLLDVDQDFVVFYLDGEPIKQWKIDSHLHGGKLRRNGRLN